MEDGIKCQEGQQQKYRSAKNKNKGSKAREAINTETCITGEVSSDTHTM